MSRYLLCFTFVSLAQAQLVTFGGKIGAPLLDPTPNPIFNSTNINGRWAGGPTVEVHLPYRLSVEVDVLFSNRRFNSTTFGPLFTPPATSFSAALAIQSKTRSVEVPILLKYRFFDRSWTPFVTAGYSATHDHSEGTSLQTCIAPEATCLTNSGRGNFFKSSIWRDGPTAGGGVEFKKGHFRIAPEVRWLHLDQPRGNQVTALVGFTFGK